MVFLDDLVVPFFWKPPYSQAHALSYLWGFPWGILEILKCQFCPSKYQVCRSTCQFGRLSSPFPSLIAHRGCPSFTSDNLGHLLFTGTKRTQETHGHLLIFGLFNCPWFRMRMIFGLSTGPMDPNTGHTS